MARNKTKQGGASAPVRGYDNWTIGELRQKLARRSAEELDSLLGYEKGGRKRKGAIDAIKRALSEVSEAASGGSGKSSRSSKRPSNGGSKEASPGKKSQLGGVMERVRTGVK